MAIDGLVTRGAWASAMIANLLTVPNYAWLMLLQGHQSHKESLFYLLDLILFRFQYPFQPHSALSISLFMPPPLGAGGIMFSGCPSVRPSVRSLKYPLLTCTWVRWSTRPTVTVLRHVRPSGEVSGHLPENAWREWPEILHADRLQNWLVYGHGLLIFLILALFWLSETG